MSLRRIAKIKCRSCNSHTEDIHRHFLLHCPAYHKACSKAWDNAKLHPIRKGDAGVADLLSAAGATGRITDFVNAAIFLDICEGMTNTDDNGE